MTDAVTVPKAPVRVDIRSVIIFGVITFGGGWYIAMNQAGAFSPSPAVRVAPAVEAAAEK